MASQVVSRTGFGVEALSRGLAAAGVLLSADVHFDLWYAGGFRDIKTIGPLFLLNAIGGLVIGLAAIVWRHWIPSLLCAGFGAATLVAFYISASVGLFGLHETLGGESEILAEIAEYVALVFGLVAAATYWRGTRNR
ncbi:MAG: hypothetical protein JO147_05280 [Actinobacteria bacterium]|nr:hypothetical protein [Actinomycetota bacterium]